jgi:UDP-N-acetylmuramate dehydrogenase
VPLAPLATLGVGGAARWFHRATTLTDIARAHAWASANRTPVFVLGGGSNVVVADRGVDGLVLQVALEGVTLADHGEATFVRAAAGVPWDTVVSAVTARGLAGVECLSGIPGSVGGTPVQNVGAYGQEVADSIDTVSAFDRESGGFVELTNGACGFSYRTSRFRTTDRGRFVICGVTFRLRRARPTLTYPDLITELRDRGITQPDLEDTRAAVLAVRRRKGMVIDGEDPDTRSVGSFFVNPVVTPAFYERLCREQREGPVPGFTLPSGDVKIPAAWLIERAGFSRGYTDGRVGLSSKHPLALVNRGGATAAEVVRFAVRIKRAVADRFGVALSPEPVFAGFEDDSAAADLLRVHL